MTKKKSTLVKTSISFSELQADKSCKAFWNQEQENKRLYACRNKEDPSKPIFYYYEHTGTDTDHSRDLVSIERVSGLRYQDTNIHPQLSIRLMNGFQDSLSSYPDWITNWKNSYLEVEKDCTLNLSTLSNNTITYAYCKTKDKTEPIQINL